MHLIHAYHMIAQTDPTAALGAQWDSWAALIRKVGYGLLGVGLVLCAGLVVLPSERHRAKGINGIIAFFIVVGVLAIALPMVPTGA